MGFIFLSCGAHNAELIKVGQELIPAVRAFIFAPGGIRSKSTRHTIMNSDPSERMHVLIAWGKAVWTPQMVMLHAFLAAMD